MALITEQLLNDADEVLNRRGYNWQRNVHGNTPHDRIVCRAIAAARTTVSELIREKEGIEARKTDIEAKLNAAVQELQSAMELSDMAAAA